MASPVDPNNVLMTGENSFIRLSHDGGATLASRFSRTADDGVHVGRRHADPQAQFAHPKLVVDDGELRARNRMLLDDQCRLRAVVDDGRRRKFGSLADAHAHERGAGRALLGDSPASRRNVTRRSHPLNREAQKFDFSEN